MRRTLVWTAGIAAMIALTLWVANNTEWVDRSVPMPLKGEALSNPFYGVQRFANQLGATTAWHRSLTLPSTDAVVVLSAWNWGIVASRRQSMERWVESGGRLVVDSTLIGGEQEFEKWSGIVLEFKDEDDDKLQTSTAPAPFNPCRRFEEVHGPPPAAPAPRRYWLCDANTYSYLRTERPIDWALRDESGMQALRVGVGRGSVTVFNATPFQYRDLFDGDHGTLFVVASQFRKGDVIHFLSEEEHPSLLALIWRHGAPVVVLALAAIALMLWRGMVRFGPMAAAPQTARRSLAEQIRGTGEFLARRGGAESLHRAVVRALDEATVKRVKGYAREGAQERASIVARLTGFDAGALTDAIYHPRTRRPQDVRRTIALLEAARRLIFAERRASSHD
jgi:hypothetical protein